MAKLTGQWLQSPMIVNNTQNVFINDPGFAAFQAQLIAALRPFPEARNAVIACFEKLDAEPSASPAVTYEAA
jgi:hypothetical protein